MNMSKLTKSSVIFATVLALFQPVITQSSNVEYDDAYACVWLPVCGDPDYYTPVSRPTDSKTETQDAKDEKVA